MIDPHTPTSRVYGAASSAVVHLARVDADDEFITAQAETHAEVITERMIIELGEAVVLGAIAAIEGCAVDRASAEDALADLVARSVRAERRARAATQ